MSDDDDEGFQRLDCHSKAVCGPLGVLLAGFDKDEEEEVAALLALAGAPEGTPLRRLSRAGLARSLGDALASAPDDVPLPSDALPRAVLLGGLRDGQIQSFVQFFRLSDLEPPVFAACTPHSLERSVREVLVDLLEEQRAVAGS